jgi:hypothetical protein
MKKMLSFLLLCTIIIQLNCQNPNPIIESSKVHNKKNSYYLEIMGNGFLYSINYDRIIYEKEKFKISGRIGFTYMPYWEVFTEVRGPGIPLELNFLFGKRSNLLELGFGATYFYFTDPYYDQKNYHFLMENLRLGYRHQKVDGRLLFRIAIVPISTFPIDPAFDDDGWIIPYYAGISIGFTSKFK